MQASTLGVSFLFGTLQALGSHQPSVLEEDEAFFHNAKQDSETTQKQTKNRNETGSNLSLGTRLTVLSKRLGRKRCCDTTPDRCLECNRLTILTAHC